MYHVSAQGVDERMINVHYYYYYVNIIVIYVFLTQVSRWKQHGRHTITTF